MSNHFESGLKDWIEKEKLAIELISISGQLWFDRSVELVIFRKKIIDVGVNTILSFHLRAREIIKQELTIETTISIARALLEMDLAPSKIDLGKLGHEWINEKKKYENVKAFVKDKLKKFEGSNDYDLTPQDVVLFGFGRIGRIAARLLVAQTGKGEQLRVRAIVTRNNDAETIAKRAELLRNDSIHGTFKGTVLEDFDNKRILVNGQPIEMIASNDPSTIDYTAHGIENALLIDNTGAFRDEAGLSKHLKAKGISKVLLTAPGKGDLKNIVYGINHKDNTENENILSAASCTTNAIVPVLKVIEDEYGIDFGHIETIHSYTNDQNLLDNFHNKYRRGRSAPLNLVITETGAGKAVAKALPQLAGKLTGNAVRVPTPNGSLVILNLTLKKEVNGKEDINKVLKHTSLHGELIEQIEFSENNELVSTDIIGNSHPGIVDGAATLVSGENPKNVVLYVWYDNEYGYTEQVIRLAKYISGVRRPTYY